jgi:hypothetical protein
MQTATQTAEIPAHLMPGQEASEIIIERVEDKAMKVIVFVGDLMTDEQKQGTGYQLGGKIFPDAKTLPYGILSCCALTPLKQGMLSVGKHLVDKKDWKNYTNSYVATNQYNPATNRFENVRVGADANSKDLLYKAIYPVQEIGNYTGKMDGVVEVSGLNTAADITEAQFYVFPDWLEIISGVKKLPILLRKLRDIIENKTVATSDTTLSNVGRALLRSCDQYQSFARKYIQFQTGLIKDAEKFPGVSQQYDEIAERFFVSLEITRQDSLIQNLALQQNQSVEANSDIKTAISLLTQVVAGQVQQSATFAPVQQNPTMTASDKEAYAKSLEPSVTGEVGFNDEENEKSQNVAENAACSYPKQGNPCKGVVIPNTNPPRCVAHKDK